MCIIIKILDFYNNAIRIISPECSQTNHRLHPSLYEGRPRVFLTILFAILLNSSRFSRHIIAASTFAPLSSFGSGKWCATTKSYSLGPFMKLLRHVAATDKFANYLPTWTRRSIESSPHSAQDSTVPRTAHSPSDHRLVRAGWKYKLDHRQILKRGNYLLIFGFTLLVISWTRHSLFGWNISQVNFIFGGLSG